jgi:hypothetical protein
MALHCTAPCCVASCRVASRGVASRCIELRRDASYFMNAALHFPASHRITSPCFVSRGFAQRRSALRCFAPCSFSSRCVVLHRAALRRAVFATLHYAPSRYSVLRRNMSRSAEVCCSALLCIVLLFVALRIEAR